jgi:hypothetical protein
MGYGKRGALSGAASGAATGSAFGPIGTGVGAAVGGLAGWLTGRGQDKAVNEQYERDKKAEGQSRTNAFTRFRNEQGGRKEQTARLNDMTDMGRFLGAFGGREKAPPSLLKWFENMRNFEPEFVYEGPTAERPIMEPFDYTGLMQDVAAAYVGTKASMKPKPTSPGTGAPMWGAGAPQFQAAPIDVNPYGRAFLGGR